MNRNFWGSILAVASILVQFATTAKAFTNDNVATETTLYRFPNYGPPEGAIIKASDNNYYGTTVGSVYKLTPAGQVTTLYYFPYSGSQVAAGVIEGPDGNLYGTTQTGGLYDFGTVYNISKGGAFTVLYSFSSEADGRSPMAALTLGTDGNFYGSTSSGGTNGYGTIFRMTASGELTTLHAFAHADGGFPSAQLLLGPDGNFYGTTNSGGDAGGGTVFKMTPDGELTTLTSFTGLTYADVVQANGALVLGGDGNFYGASGAGGSNSLGAIYKITSDGIVTTLHTFSGGTDGLYPEGGLTLGSDGYFYGTTIYGGNYLHQQNGTVFRISSDGVLTTLYSFLFRKGSEPNSALLEVAPGMFYGTTLSGGKKEVTRHFGRHIEGYGAIFSIKVPDAAGGGAASVPRKAPH